MVVRKEVWVVWKTMHKNFVKGLKQVRTGITKTQSGIDRMRNPMKRLGATFRFQRMQFQMWALGIMFFGMQMMRTFGRIAKSSFDTFNKVMGESLNSAREAMMGLTASTEMLKFSIGNAIASALEPLMPIILAIIDAISDWVEKHPKLTTALVLGGVALGTFMFFAGQLFLFISSLVIMWASWGTAILGVIGPILSAVAGISGLWIVIGAIILIIAVLMAAWKKNWFGFRDIVKEVVGTIVDVVKVWWEIIVEIFELVWQLIKAIFTGEWGKIPGILSKIFAKLLELVFAIFFGILKIVWAVLVGIIKLFINFLKALWGVLVKTGMKIIEWFKKWWGVGGIWGLMKGILEGIVNMVLKAFGKIMTIVIAAAKASNKVFETGFDISGLERLKGMRADFSGSELSMSTTPSPSVNITIEGNVIGEEMYIKKLGETVAANMRTYGNNPTVYG